MTGGGSGIGLATVERFVQEARVAVGDVDDGPHLIDGRAATKRSPDVLVRVTATGAGRAATS